MKPKTRRWIGMALTGLVGLFLIGGSGIPKFLDWPGKKEMFDHLGITAELAPVLGIVEIAATLLFLIPRTSFLGAIVVTGYLGGAVWAHVRVGDPWIFPVVIGAVLWTALGLRRPEIFSLVLGNPLAASPSDRTMS